MANINQPTLILFESVRRSTGYIPSAGSREVFKINTSTIVLSTIRDDPDNYRFDLQIYNYPTNVGSGEFIIYGDSNNTMYPYSQVIVNNTGKLIVDDKLTVTSDVDEIDVPGLLTVDGTLELLDNATLSISNNGKIIVNSGGTLTINGSAEIIADNEMLIYGTINIDYYNLHILESNNIVIDENAIVNVSGFDPNRATSIADFITELKRKYHEPSIPVSKYISTIAKATASHKAGNINEPSQVLEISLDIGYAPLGDFKVSFLGIPNYTEKYMQSLSDLIIRKEAVLYITEMFQDGVYVQPTLNLSYILGNTKEASKCIVYGSIVVDGKNSSIELDGGKLIIEEGGSIYLNNEAKIISNTSVESLIINGKLYIEDLSQLEQFISENISFGINGKIIILNKNNTDDKKVLYTIPIGIYGSRLYELFQYRLSNIEYHIPENCGIGIDIYYDNYGRDLHDWYGNMRLEKAIMDGYIVWYPGAFIEIDSKITPWIKDDISLAKIGNLFNTTGSTDQEKLQSAIERFKYAKCNDITFRIKDGMNMYEFILSLGQCNMISAIYNPSSTGYILETDNTGTFFIRDGISNISLDKIINSESRKVIIDNNHVEFFLNND